MLHTFNFNAHLAGLAGKDAGGAFGVFRVEVREFGVDDFHQLGLGKSGDLLFVRFAGAGGDAGGLLEKQAARGCYDLRLF